MIDWIRNFRSSDASQQTSESAEPETLKELRRGLRRLESVFMEGAWDCRQICPGDLPDSPEEFSEMMIDLHRGLIVKVLVEVARADRRWSSAERAAALIVLRHAWGTTIAPDQIRQALKTTVELADSLEWDSLLAPFRKYPPLQQIQGTLLPQIMRVANLIAKADGDVSETEVAALQNIQLSMEMVLASHSEVKKASSGKSGAAKRNSESARASSTKAVTAKKRPSNSVTPDPENQRGGMPKLQTSDELPAADQRLAEAIDELHQLVGLTSVKKDMEGLISFLKIQAERVKLGLPETQVSLHTVFQGNPGTGKTTVARIFGKALGALGILQKGHTVETDRSGLVARFAGQTGPLVNEKIDSALDGVLFIDEAYSLVAGQGEDQFGEEAVQVLLKRMEDDRKRLIVILAGYPEPMKTMLRSNPGMSSRFQQTITFPDYTADELLQVFEGLCEKHQYVLSSDARRKLLTEFESRVAASDEHFGNARLARNIFETAIRRKASRIINTVPLTRETLTTITTEDLGLKQ